MYRDVSAHWSIYTNQGLAGVVGIMSLGLSLLIQLRCYLVVTLVIILNLDS